MITILNTSILTQYGQYIYTEITKEEAIGLLNQSEAEDDGWGHRGDGWQSAVGHQSTAAVLSELLGRNIEMNRIEYRQKVGDTALIFKMKGRPKEGSIMTREEIEASGYEFGRLFRMA